MALPDVYVKATLVSAAPQKPQFFNVFYYKPAAAPTFTNNLMADSAAIGAVLGPLLANPLQSTMTTACSVVGLNVDLIEGGQSYDTATIINQPGIINGDELADFEAAVIQKRTETAGKSGRGRWYLGPIAEVLTDENYIDIGAFTNFLDVAADWMSDFTALGVAWHPQLYSKRLALLTQIKATYVDPKLGQLGGRKSHSIL